MGNFSQGILPTLLEVRHVNEFFLIGYELLEFQ